MLQATISVIPTYIGIRRPTYITEDNLSLFVYRLFHEDLSPMIETNLNDIPTISMSYIQHFGI